MGLNSNFFVHPSPQGRRVYVADDRLPAIGDVDVLNDHALEPFVIATIGKVCPKVLHTHGGHEFAVRPSRPARVIRCLAGGFGPGVCLRKA